MRSPARISIARKILTHQKRRLALALSAMTFTVLIMFMELGFFNGINDSQSRLPPLFNADLVMMDKKSIHLNKFEKMDRARLQQALMFEEVRDVIPVFKGNVGLKNKKTKLTKIIFVLAFPPDSDPLRIPGYQAVKEELKKQGTVLFDRLSRKIFGEITKEEIVEINEVPFRVGGFVEMGPNFSIDGTILMSDSTWLRGRWTNGMDSIAYGLIRAKEGTDAQDLKRKILQTLPKDILVLTPEEMRKREVFYTIKAAPLGAIFGVGMVIGFIIGVIICYQILYNQITDHMPQYATLRAMGFTDRFLRNVVVQQAIWLSVLGFVPGMVAAYFLYLGLQDYTGILMFFTAGRILLVFSLTVFMCVVAGLIAVRKVIHADPAELY
jgi:putative ABC transport system permease protein